MHLGKILILLGAALIIFGLLMIYSGKIPLGRLPGDIRIERENFTFYFPLTTSVLFSLFISLLFWIFRR